MSNKFAIIHNLDQLTEAQRQQYLRDASVYIGLDPDLNGLDLIWLNTEEGIRRLTAYARRGTTDLLRGIHGITVSSLDQHDGPGYVSFKATGKDRAGRQEIAVGAAFTEGLKGDRIAAAVATAQTRSLRRLTLQFVGLAVLDESEVNAFPNSASQVTTVSQLSLAPQPIVQPSNDPGKDITAKVKRILENPTSYSALSSPGDPSGLVSAITSVTGQTPVPIQENQEQFEARQAKLRADAISKLNGDSGILVNKKTRRDEDGQLNPNSPMEFVPPKKTRKPRSPNKPKVDLGPSAPVTTKIPVSQDPQTQAQVAAVLIAAVPEQATAVATPPPVVILAAPPPAPSKPRLTPEQVRPFRQRLFRLVNDSLEPNGFTPKEGMGNADKMRSFATMMFSDVTNMNELSIEQWEKYLTTLENKIKEIGPAETVKFIEESIGL